VLDEVGFAEVPRWIRICYNLKELNLNRNSLITIRKDELPSSLTTLSLKGNCLTSIDLYCLRKLTHLNLKKNQLTTLNLTENDCLRELSIRGNE
jgi:Leucine-rich repeat (LRR) protein